MSDPNAMINGPIRPIDMLYQMSPTLTIKNVFDMTPETPAKIFNLPNVVSQDFVIYDCGSSFKITPRDRYAKNNLEEARQLIHALMLHIKLLGETDKKEWAAIELLGYPSLVVIAGVGAKTVRLPIIREPQLRGILDNFSKLGGLNLKSAPQQSPTPTPKPQNS